MELRELINAKNEAIKKYSEMQKNKIIELCRECGLYDVDVIAKEKKGRICVERESYSRDYEIKFYHYTKIGSLSKTATYVGFYILTNDTDEEIKEKLKNTFSLAL